MPTRDDRRSDPETHVEAALDDLGIPRRSERREAILAFWRALRERGSAPADELDGAVRTASLAAVAGTLEDLPGVDREADQSPEPEEIDVETMADVIAGREALEAEPTETWRFDDEAAAEPGGK